jgi:chromosome segregation ATPase
MTEIEIKELVEKKVGKLLTKRLMMLGGFFGVANLVAVVVLFWSVTNEAKNVTREQTRATAEEYAKAALGKFEEITNAARARIAELDSQYATFNRKIGQTEAEFKHISSFIEGIDKDSKSLRTTLANIKPDDFVEFERLVKLIKGAPSDDLQKFFTTIDSKLMQREKSVKQLAARVAELQSYIEATFIATGGAKIASRMVSNAV